jgi:hypothetical protein
MAWLKSFRRLTLRYGVRDDIHFASLQLACCLLLAKRLSQALLSPSLEFVPERGVAQEEPGSRKNDLILQRGQKVLV